MARKAIRKFDKKSNLKNTIIGILKEGTTYSFLIKTNLGFDNYDVVYLCDDIELLWEYSINQLLSNNTALSENHDIYFLENKKNEKEIKKAISIIKKINNSKDIGKSHVIASNIEIEELRIKDIPCNKGEFLFVPKNINILDEIRNFILFEKEYEESIANRISFTKIATFFDIGNYIYFIYHYNKIPKYAVNINAFLKLSNKKKIELIKDTVFTENLKTANTLYEMILFL